MHSIIRSTDVNFGNFTSQRKGSLLPHGVLDFYKLKIFLEKKNDASFKSEDPLSKCIIVQGSLSAY